MVLVMIGHIPPTMLVSKVIYSFHIPFFFALSGFLHDPSRAQTLKTLLMARWRTLGLPYLGYSAIGLSTLAVMGALGSAPFDPSVLLKPLMGTFLGIRNYSIFHGTLWFVVCLFLTEVLYFLLRKAGSQNPSIALILTFPLAAYSLHPLVRLPFFPFSVDAAMIAVVFFAFGQWIRQAQLAQARWWSHPALLPAAFLVWALSTWRGGTVDMYTDTYTAPVWFFASASAGILASLLVAPRLVQVGWVGWIGRHSLVILALHQWLAFPLALRLVSHNGTLSLIGPFQPYVNSLLVCLVGGLALWPICLVFDRWLPFLVGGGSRRKAPSTPSSTGA